MKNNNFSFSSIAHVINVALSLTQKRHRNFKRQFTRSNPLKIHALDDPFVEGSPLKTAAVPHRYSHKGIYISMQPIDATVASGNKWPNLI